MFMTHKKLAIKELIMYVMESKHMKQSTTYCRKKTTFMKLVLNLNKMLFIVFLLCSSVYAEEETQFPEEGKLFDICRDGNIAELEKYIKRGGRLDIVDHNRETAYEVAIQAGNSDIAILLLKHQNYIGLLGGEPTPLHVAAKEANTHVLKYLLDKGCEVNGAGFTPLDYAIYNPNFENVRLLLSHGAVARSWQLKQAIIKERVDIVALLIDHGAEVTPDMLETALCASYECLRLLLEHGCDANHADIVGACLNGCYKELVLLFEYGKKLRKDEANKAMNAAIVAKNKYIVQLLLEHGAHITQEPRLLAKEYHATEIMKLFDEWASREDASSQ